MTPRARRVRDVLGPLEAEVMTLLWRRGEAPVGEVLERLNRRRDDPLAYTTAMTVLVRLWEKGLLDRRREGRAFVYRPIIERDELMRAEAARAARDLIERFGDAALAGFVDEVRASDEQLTALERLLEQETDET